MKIKTKTFNILSVFILCFISIPSIAQSYNSIFGIDSTKFQKPFCNLDQGYFREQIITGDTTINGAIYKKVGTVNSNNSVDHNIYGGANGFTKEDSTMGKAWFISTIESMNGMDTLEFLIMDLSLSLSDTFIIHKQYGDSTITTIDSTYTISGTRHVRTNYVPYGGNQKLTFIEGIGTNYGINYMHESLNLCPCLRTYNKDNNQVYLNTNCNPIGAINEENKDEILIYPQPIEEKGTFKYKNPNNYKSELLIFSSYGQTIQKLQTTNDQFQIRNKLNGIYFYKLSINDQFKSSGKIIFID